MAKIDLWLQGTPPAAGRAGAVVPVPDIVKKEFWSWYSAHQNDTVLKVAFVSVPLRRLRAVFEQLFGPKPDWVE